MDGYSNKSPYMKEWIAQADILQKEPLRLKEWMADRNSSFHIKWHTDL